MSQRLALTLEYLGHAYHGWQQQSQDLPTLQAAVEHAIGMIAQHSVGIICAGRTDTGVHALNQVIHFDTSTSRQLVNWIRGVNYYLPSDIAVTHAAVMPEQFHARFSALNRTYHYVIDRSPTPPAIMRDRVNWLADRLDITAMQQAAHAILGEHDFRSFQGRSCQAQTTHREILQAEWYDKGPYLVFKITANAFLHHMVRYLVGAMVEIGRGNRSLSWFKQLLTEPNRQNRKYKQSAKGLYLTRVAYPQRFDTLLQSDYSKEQRLLPGLL